MSSKFKDVLDDFNCNKYHTKYITLGLGCLEEMQLNCSDARHHDDHQEDQDDQEYP